MSTPEAFQVVLAYFAGSGPAFWGPQNDHGPTRSECFSCITRLFLILSDLGNASLHSGCHSLVHRRNVATFNKIWRPAITNEESLQLLVADTSKHSRVVDLVLISAIPLEQSVLTYFIAVQMQHWENCTIRDWIEKLGRMPACGQRTSL